MKNKTKSGFTLVELIVVIAILGIIVLITLPKFQQYVKQAEAQKELANTKTIYRAALAYDENNNMVKDPSGDSMMFFNFLEQKSLLQPYLSDDIKMLAYQWDVNEPGEYAVYKTLRMYNNPNGKPNDVYTRIEYLVYYFDPRIHTAGTPFVYPQTALLNGDVPVITSEGMTYVNDESGFHVKYMTVDEYLEKKAQEDKN